MEKVRECNRCKRILPYVAFYKRCGRKDGLQADCIECYNTYRRQYYRNTASVYKKNAVKNSKKTKAHLRRLITKLKAISKCKMCGEKHPACLQFHHVNPKEKERTVGEMITRCFSLARFKKELRKCEILCANCHFKFHYDERMGLQTKSSEAGNESAKFMLIGATPSFPSC